jgi:hypothetical protein
MSEYQEVETIIGKKLFKGNLLYCVKWKHMGVLNSTWETVDSFANIKKLKAMSKMLDVRCRRIRKKRARERKEKVKESKRYGKGGRKKKRRKKISLEEFDKDGLIRIISSGESIKKEDDDESVDCVFQDEYVVDIGSEVFKQNRRLKNCWEEKLAREKEKRLNKTEEIANDLLDEVVVIHVKKKSKKANRIKEKTEPEKFFSNKNVLYNFDDSLNPKVQNDSFSQDTSLICKRHSNQAVETLGLYDLKIKHDQQLSKTKNSILSGSGEAERGAEEFKKEENSIIAID